MIRVSPHLFKTRSEPLLNIITISKAVVQVRRVVLPCGRAGKDAVGQGLGRPKVLLLLVVEELPGASVGEVFLACHC